MAGIHPKRLRVLGCALALALGLMTMGCATGGQTGALAGSGVGALIGQVVGGNTAGTLIGAAAGAGVGYLIGNDIDKTEAQKRAAAGQPPETGFLAGTKWKAVEVTPPPKTPYETYIVEFGKDGWVKTTETFADGTQKVDRERYRVSGDTLIVNNPGYLINAKHYMEGGRLVIHTEKFRAVFMRLS